MAADIQTLVRPNSLLLNLLKSVGAQKETFTMKEVIHHLGQYIMAKQLFDKKQQHIVHCSNDPLGELFGVQNFSVKDPRRLYAMIFRNLLTTDSEEESSSNGQPSEPERESQKSDSISLTLDDSTDTSSNAVRPNSLLLNLLKSVGAQKETFTMKEVIHHLGQYIMAKQLFDKKQQHIVHCSNDPLGELFGVQNFSVKDPRRLYAMIFRNLLTTDSEEESSSNGQPSEPERESQKSDSISLTLDDSTDTSSNADHETGSVSDQFSLEFEVESVYSEDYSPSGGEESLPDDDLDDEVNQVTTYQDEESRDSLDEETEISEADYWKYSQCDAMNPPVPRCRSLHIDWLPNQSEKKNCPLKRKEIEDSLKDACIDVPDGKKPKLTDMQDSVLARKDDEGIESFCQPSTSYSQEEYRESDQVHQESLEGSLPLSSVEPCMICQTRLKNGCIVHGRTGHLMACYTCTKKLQKRNKPCPVCRQPIQKIVLTYFS